MNFDKNSCVISKTKMKYTKLTASEQIFDTPIDNDPDPTSTETSLHCDLCKKTIGEWGIINIKQLETTKQITFLCSELCKIRFKNKRICQQCGTEFNRSGKKAKNIKFCSRECYSNGTKQRCGLCQVCGEQIPGFDRNKHQLKKCCGPQCAAKMRSFRYRTHFFCDRTNHWVKIEDAKKVSAKHYTCPKYGHENNRLRISSREAQTEPDKG